MNDEHNNERDPKDIEFLTFTPEEYALRFTDPAPLPQTPQNHSPVWGYEVKPDQYGLVFADTTDEAMDKVTRYYDADESRVTLFQIDNDQDIIEFC